ncbi:chemotaxis protein MotA [Nitrosomonas cryotolerans]|uniref:Chemotaxis protein MotA n=1 Tax=Nitrosomonas cryotolerans ATCC 49181 TaxID=1131553 RepID=A0A1N6J3M3_9PROT|nr:flagellar motor stator protein MotA [Nitrosomonas cryotolerans]SFQ14801.1 chemotaxis protein MotA [Nitrosomonas cryotolerans]SIO38823.1 chemotaxis protein MotA [Nitrosomonas cryotolerans ATCC 49181]
MLVSIGYIVIIISVFGGFALAGGHLASLWQPVELLMIGGAAIGAFIVGNSGKAIKATLKALPRVFKGSKYTKALYMELMTLLYEILGRIRREGLMSIESDIDDPTNSPLFAKYPAILSDHHVTEFITDYLRLMAGGNLNPLEIENLMDSELETHHQEEEIPIHTIAKIAEGLPAFGIVAAVMGVVHTMESVHLPPAQLGILIAAALVGTFLGILLAYGFVSPLAGKLEQQLHESSKLLECIKITLLANLNGYAPVMAIEFGRKVLFTTERPSFMELEAHVKQSKSK